MIRIIEEENHQEESEEVLEGQPSGYAYYCTICAYETSEPMENPVCPRCGHALNVGYANIEDEEHIRFGRRGE